MSIRINTEGNFKSGSLFGNGSSSSSSAGNDTNWFNDIMTNLSAGTTGDSNTFWGALGDFANKLATTGWDDWTGNTANRENIAYQKDYNQQVFNRADTQYQRTVADLRAAGLSSQLAAGAPSTVAGQSAAPQRSVGNESQAIERLIGMISSIKQVNANSALAAAQVDKTKAETASIEAQNGTYGERHALDMILKQSEADMNREMTKLYQIEGQSKADAIAAQIQKDLSSSRYNDQLRVLAQKQSSLADAQILGQYETNKSIRQGVVKSQAEVRKIEQEIKNLGITYDKTRYEILESVARKENLNAESRKIASEIVNISLSTEVMRYNLMMSEGLGLRTGENIPSSLWSSMSWAGNTIDDMLWGRRDTNLKRFGRQVLNWSWKWSPLRWILQDDYPFKFGK